jgi:dTDP-4-dehydrorhamnose 3,5-epimerase
LVRVIEGAVWDVAVDLRPDSPTRLRWYGLELSGDNALMLYIPPGFAHGFVTLTDHAHFTYKCTSEYDPSCERGCRWDDPTLAIAWPLTQVHVSGRDAALPPLRART